MNVKRIFFSGLVAGLVINASAVLMVPLVGDQMNEALKARSLPPMGSVAMLFVGAMSFALGIVLVWLYAAVRPKFGPGPKTAFIVSLIVWFLAYFSCNTSNVIFGFMPLQLSVIGTAWGLVEFILAGQIGAYFYYEE